MQVQESLKHTKWECKYHVVFIPKYRRKVLYQQLRRDLGEMFRELCRHKECQVVEGHLMGGPCAYAGVDTAEVFGVAGHGLRERQECHPHRADV